MEKYIPYFIEVRGCINCDTSKTYKEKHGKDYGFDHELVAKCAIIGCVNHGHDLSNPFIDPEEVIKKFKETNNPEYKKNVRLYCLQIKEKFGNFFDAIGVSIDDLIDGL